MPRFRLAVSALAAVALVVPLGVLTATDGAVARAALSSSTPARNTFAQFTSDYRWRAGTSTGTAVANGSLRIGTVAGQRTLGGTVFDSAHWTSAWTSPGHPFTELIPSWNAYTPAGTWVMVWVRGRTAGGAVSTYQNMAQWALGDHTIQRTSLGPQTDRLSHVNVDTLVTNSGVAFTSYQLRVYLLRKHGTTATPTVYSVHTVASQLASSVPATSKPLLGARTLAVPEYSQMTHRGEYPKFGGGGEAWCSPTSLSMLLGYFHALPPASSYTWVNRSYPDRFVDQMARFTYDYGYDGTGNWPFNTAVATHYLPAAFVTRLTNLRDAERFIAAGIPLEVSISFNRGELTGAPISSTPGHLVVISGFTSAGNVVVNDPAAASNSSVRRTYDRAQFERAWLRKSHGLAYAMRDAAHRFPRGYSG